MATAKLGFEDFISLVEGENKDFITKLHKELINGGCKIEVKEAKSGYVVSYSYNRKIISNYVFRKNGIIARIYGNHVADYREFLETLPQGMIKSIQTAPNCKRLLNPDDCNPKCQMGNNFMLYGERQQKCRYNAFMFLISKENNAAIEAFLLHELENCVA